MPDENSCFIVLDQGGHASRAIAFDVNGVMLEHAEVSVSTLCPQEGRVEQDPHAVIDSMQQAADTVWEALPEPYRKNVRCAALICQRSSIAMWDRHTLEPMHNIVSWQDRRAENWLADKLRADATWQKDVYQRTGLIANAHFGASKMRWLFDHVDVSGNMLQAGQLCCAPLAAYLVHNLTVEHLYAVDAGNASRTLLWNIKKSCWDEKLLRDFSIPRSVLPEVKSNLFNYGQVRMGRAQVPLQYVNGDQNAAFYAYGALQENTAYINIGTGAFCAALESSVSERGALASEDVTRHNRLLKTLVGQGDTPILMLEGTVNGAGSALDWAARELHTAIDFTRLDQHLGELDNGPLFINGIGGLGSPDWRSFFKSHFVDNVPLSVNESSVNGGPGNIDIMLRDESQKRLAAVAESIVFLLQRNIDCMVQSGVVLQRIYLSGGLSRMPALCQRLADLSGLTVKRSQEREASARGAAFWLAGCPDHWQESVVFDQFILHSSLVSDRYRTWTKRMELQLEAGG